jgi:hypothetical protein
MPPRTPRSGPTGAGTSCRPRCAARVSGWPGCARASGSWTPRPPPQADQDAKIDAWQQRVAAGAQRPGRRPDPSARTTTRNGKPPRRNTTDPDARVMKTKHHLIVGYNAQAAVTDDQIIVGADLRQEPVDAALFPDLLDTTIDQATAAGLNPTGTTHADDTADDSADHANSGDDGGDDGGRRRGATTGGDDGGRPRWRRWRRWRRGQRP